MARLQDYDPGVIEVAARRLYEKATVSLFLGIVAGASVGAAFGAVPMTPLGDAWPIPASFGPGTMILGALVGAAIGYVIGDGRAFRNRLQAQAMLTDVQRELNTAATVEALREIVGQLTEQFERDRAYREAERAAAAAAAVPLPAELPPPAPEPVVRPALLTVPPASPEPAQVFSLPEPEPVIEPAADPFAAPLVEPVEEPLPPATDFYPPVSASGSNEL